VLEGLNSTIFAYGQSGAGKVSEDDDDDDGHNDDEEGFSSMY